MSEEKGLRLVSATCPDCNRTGCTLGIHGELERCKTCDGLGHVCDWEPNEEVAP